MGKLTLAILAVVLLARHVVGASNSSYLRATAIVTNAHNHSALECWQFTEPVSMSTDAGISGAATFAFPGANETIYTVIPPRFNGGIHNAPTAQLVAFFSGLAHITLPVPATGNCSLDEAWILGGAEGFLVAVDTIGTGHITTYPSDQATVSVQIPFESEQHLPAHRTVGSGPCHFGIQDDQII